MPTVEWAALAAKVLPIIFLSCTGPTQAGGRARKLPKTNMKLPTRRLRHRPIPSPTQSCPMSPTHRTTPTSFEDFVICRAPGPIPGPPRLPGAICCTAAMSPRSRRPQGELIGATVPEMVGSELYTACFQPVATPCCSSQATVP